MPLAPRSCRSRSRSRGALALVSALCGGLGLLVVMVSAGCSPAGDRCYVEPARHDAARRLYARSGSLEVVRETLAEADWLPCEIEQTIARLEKENGL